MPSSAIVTQLFLIAYEGLSHVPSRSPLVDPFVLESREPPGVSRCGGTRLGDFLAAHQLAGRV
jgi:hypothetical protein